MLWATGMKETPFLPLKENPMDIRAIGEERIRDITVGEIFRPPCICRKSVTANKGGLSIQNVKPKEIEIVMTKTRR